MAFNFEPVPTDVEIGRTGMLFVTTLPGGPEGPEFGARGAVHRITPRNGDAHTIATGFAGATGLALGERHQIYVGELFGGKISPVTPSGPETVLELVAPADLEFEDGELFVTREVLGVGRSPRSASTTVGFRGGWGERQARRSAAETTAGAGGIWRGAVIAGREAGLAAERHGGGR